MKPTSSTLLPIRPADFEWIMQTHGPGPLTKSHFYPLFELFQIQTYHQHSRFLYLHFEPILSRVLYSIKPQSQTPHLKFHHWLEYG